MGRGTKTNCRGTISNTGLNINLQAFAYTFNKIPITCTIVPIQKENVSLHFWLLQSQVTSYNYHIIDTKLYLLIYLIMETPYWYEDYGVILLTVEY